MALLPAWQLPLIAVGVGFHLAVSWALLWRYFQARERSLLIWGLAWLVLTLHVLGIFLTRMETFALAAPLRDISHVGAALALFAGQAERESLAFRTLRRYTAGASIAMGLAAVAGLLSGSPLTTAANAAVLILMAGSAWLSRPVGTGSRDVTRWLLTAGYVTAAVHAGTYLIPFHHNASALGEIAGHALFSLLFSAAVTWQAWEHERALRLFSRTLERLNHPMSTQETLNQSLKIVADTLHVTEGWILLRQQGRGDADGAWDVAAILGFPDWTHNGLYQGPFPIDRCLCLRPVDKEALITTIKDLACVRLTAEEGRPAGRHITIPLGTGGEVQGLMCLMLPYTGGIDAGMLRLLNALGEQIGLALDRARLVDALREKEAARGRLLSMLITAQEDERRRIARELHDETGQALTALVVNLDFLVRHPVDEQLLRERLSAVRDMAELTLAEVRRVIHEMRPSALDDLGLEAAIRWLVRRFEPSGLQVSVEFRGVGTERLPGPLEITVFRLIQEACTNTLKHARATHLNISVSRRGSRLKVEVKDDGRGVDPSLLHKGSGMGLAGLKERVELMGGRLDVTSAPGQGTRVVAELPVEGDRCDANPNPDLRRPQHGEAGRTHGSAVGA